jgi:hypothetical protein
LGVEFKYSFKCICGVVLSANTELQLESILDRHSKNSKIHKAQGYGNHSGLGSGGSWA